MPHERHLNLRCFSRRPSRNQGHLAPGNPAHPTHDPPQFNLLVFEQGEHWVDNTGYVHLISTMDTQDRHDVADWLWRNQIYFYFRVLARDLASSLRVSPGRPPPIALQWPGEWLSGTALYQALRREPVGEV